MHKDVLENPSLALAPETTQPRDHDQKDNEDNYNQAIQTAGKKNKEEAEKGKISTPAQTGAKMSQSKLTGPQGEMPIIPARTEDYMELLTPAVTPKQQSLKIVMAEAKQVETDTTAKGRISNSDYFSKDAFGSKRRLKAFQKWSCA